MGTLFSQVLETNFEVHAPLAIVWAVLTNRNEYPKWNRFIISSTIVPSSSSSSTDTIVAGKTRLENILCPPKDENDERYKDDSEEIKKGENDNKVTQGKTMTFRPLILDYYKLDNNQSALYSWGGGVGGIPYLFDGIHSFQLIAISDTETRVTHAEYFSGIFIFLLKCFCLFESLVLKNGRLAFIDMNKRWKQRAERLYQESRSQ